MSTGVAHEKSSASSEIVRIAGSLRVRKWILARSTS
jgi:hypothetical protein